MRILGWLIDWIRRLIKWLMGEPEEEPSVPQTNKLLFIEPEQHYLNYGSCVLRAIVAANTKPTYETRELRGSDASPSKVDAALSEIDPALVTGIGHGAECAYTLECQTLYMSVQSLSHSICTRNLNLEKMRGRVVHLCSCLTGSELGPALIANGAKAYIGCRDSFWFFIGSGPCAGRAVQTMFLAEFQVEVSLLAGLGKGQAYRDSQARYDQEIAYWTTGEGKNDANAAEIVRALRIDKDIQTSLGDDNATVCTPSMTPLGISLGLTFGMVPVGMVLGTVMAEEARKQGVI